ncbi:hypothetical protein JTE90_003378 [Oedothorax gibbosus]|uniref:Uncharacterized protein n=1 Tax=Oedothorax gibbosus TaxID=931172 RepID=A0AAV6TZ27_9ARAC|nr:hypothetical protein JTE90_003378 [Oedothorax gibbosus]
MASVGTLSKATSISRNVAKASSFWLTALSRTVNRSYRAVSVDLPDPTKNLADNVTEINACVLSEEDSLGEKEDSDASDEHSEDSDSENILGAKEATTLNCGIPFRTVAVGPNDISQSKDCSLTWILIHLGNTKDNFDLSVKFFTSMSGWNTPY